jgi:hypothetical protein
VVLTADIQAPLVRAQDLIANFPELQSDIVVLLHQVGSVKCSWKAVSLIMRLWKGGSWRSRHPGGTEGCQSERGPYRHF